MTTDTSVFSIATFMNKDQVLKAMQRVIFHWFRIRFRSV